MGRTAFDCRDRRFIFTNVRKSHPRLFMPANPEPPGSQWNFPRPIQVFPSLTTPPRTERQVGCGFSSALSWFPSSWKSECQVSAKHHSNSPRFQPSVHMGNHMDNAFLSSACARGVIPPASHSVHWLTWCSAIAIQYATLMEYDNFPCFLILGRVQITFGQGPCQSK
jgi:hypothetical protein